DADNLQRAWAEREQGGATLDPRPIDTMADNAWRNLHDRLAAYAALPIEHHPEAARAADLVGALFPDGLSFLKLDYSSQWAEPESPRPPQNPDELDPDMSRLAGPAFLTEVRRCHVLYGEVIGATKPKERRAPVPLSEPLRALTQSLIAMCAQLVALYYEGDGIQRSQVRAALRPIDEFRAAALRRARAAAGASVPATS